MATVLKVKDRSGKVVPGRFKVKVSFGNEHKGTRYYRTATVTATTRTIDAVAAEVEARLRAEEAGKPGEVEAADEGEPAKPGTFAELAGRYVLDGKVTAGWRDRHAKSRVAQLHAVERSALGDVLVRDLRREHLVQHLAEYAAQPKPGGGKRGPESIRQRRVFIGAVVDFALTDPDTELRGNPAAKLGKGAKAAATGTTVAERDIPDVATFGRILNRASSRWQADIDRRVNGTGYRGKLGYIGRAELFADFATFMLWSGMRPGEVCALQAHKVKHLANGKAEVRVDRSIEPVDGGGWALKPTKTEDERTITVHADAAAILLRRQVANEAQAMSDGVEPRRRGFIFAAARGTAAGWGDESLNPTGTTHWWAKLRSFEPGLDGLRLYDLRHSHCSELHAMGLHDAAIAEHMGHSIEVTNSTYNHKRPGADDQLADAIEAAAAR